jgi:UDP-GlcNAc3NAcA epimerase
LKIVTVIGARPQFIKASVVSKALKKQEHIHEIIVHTGQHYDENMSDVFFDQMGIPKPDYRFDVNNTSHGAMTGRMIEKIEKVFLEEKPDMVLIYGDTNSTLAGALAASKLHISVAHVEAGLRSFNMKMPEEINRIVSDRLSTILLCPSDIAVKNLKLEGFQEFENSNIHVVGDVMKDSSMFFAQHAKPPKNFDINLRDFFLCTFHRQENTDDLERLKSIVDALNEIHENIAPVILPLHPRTQKMIQKNYLKLDANVINPVGYIEMLWLIKKSKAVLTDSGGLQKEAYFFQKPCITLRDETEWVELVEVGANKITGANKKCILDSIHQVEGWKIPNKPIYGDGNSSEKIASILGQQA